MGSQCKSNYVLYGELRNEHSHRILHRESNVPSEMGTGRQAFLLFRELGVAHRENYADNVRHFLKLYGKQLLYWQSDRVMKQFIDHFQSNFNLGEFCKKCGLPLNLQKKCPSCC